jgi:phage-related protein
MFKALGGAIAGLVKAAWNIAKTLWEMILDAWDSVKEHFAESIEECGGHVVGGILCGIIDGLINIGKWLYDNVLTPFLDGFKEVFGIHSPSTVMAEMGVFLIEGLLQGIANTWGNITSFLSEKWEEIKAGMSNTWESIKSTASEKWDNLKSTCSEKFGNIRDKISEKWSEIKTNTSEKWESIKSTCSEKWADIKEDATAVFGDLKEGMVGIWESIWTNIKNTINCIIGGIEGLANGVVKGVNFIFKALNKVQVDVPDWVTDLTGITTFGFNFGMLKEVKIPRLMADGGFVDTGELFIAREAGAEMVGSIGRKTAVANNDQIVAGIANGVAEANSGQNALLREQNDLLRALLNKDNDVNIDGRKITKEIDKIRKQRGATIITGGAY